MTKSASFSPELEALRGWAILLVFLFHADGVITGNDRIGTLVSPVMAFITAGHTGVTLFFVLSAFLLSRPFFEEGRGGRRVDRRNFYRRRILRIMPLYTVAVVVAVALSAAKPTALADGLRALFFLNSFTGTIASLIPYSAVWWSLATEVQFYLALPILGLCLRSKTGRVLGLALLLSWAIAYLIVAINPGLVSIDARFRLSLSLFGRAPAFLAGITASWAVFRYGERIRSAMRENRWLRNGGSDGLLLLALFGQGLVLQQITYRGFIRTEIAAPLSIFAESILWTAVLLLVLLAPLRIRQLITNRLTTTLGMLSYSIYLIHEPIIFFGGIRLINLGYPLEEDLILRGGVFALTFLVCVTLSAITYRLVERPFLIRKARIDR
jgi:peptidoglycan/LPS O-acetylase OafA/YrhL